MSLSLQDKQAVVAELSEELGKAQSVVIAEYRGMGVGAMTELRRKARAEGVYLKVLKNTLARRAVDGTPFKALADQRSIDLRAQAVALGDDVERVGLRVEEQVDRDDVERE